MQDPLLQGPVSGSLQPMRFACLSSVLFSLSLLGSACSGDDDGEGGDPTAGETSTGGAGETGTGASTGGEPAVTASGDAFAFGPYTMIAGATVRILEMPEHTTTTDAEGHFELPGLPPEAKATFVFEAEGFPTTYTRTFTLPEAGEALERLTFQVPENATFDLLASVVEIEPDPSACQIASTVTRVGKSIYDEGAHGEAEATVSIEPSLPADSGPIYFNAQVIPQRDLTETSEDGGVLFVNVPPGTYTLTAEKPGVQFDPVSVVCDPGVLVNASPPYGLQAQ